MTTTSNRANIRFDNMTPKLEYHFDVGYAGVYAHYRSTDAPEIDEKKLVDTMSSLALYFDKNKKGVTLDNITHLTDMLKTMKDMGFYMVNFESKTMLEHQELLVGSDFAINCTTLC